MANRPRTRSSAALDPNSPEYGFQVLANTPELYGDWLRIANPEQYRDWLRVNRPEAYGDFLLSENPTAYARWRDKRLEEQAAEQAATRQRQAQIDALRIRLVDATDKDLQALIQKQIDAMEDTMAAPSGLKQEARNFFEESNTGAILFFVHHLICVPYLILIR
jgi:hypothetical protein